MPKAQNITDAQITASYTGADEFLMEMQDFAKRIGSGNVDRIDDPVSAAKNFALIARAAADMTCALLMVSEMQKQTDEIKALREAVGR